jgi:hypothetical protein
LFIIGKMVINNKSLIFVVFSFILVSMFAVSVSADMSNCPFGIVSYWKFDETSGITASDSIGANNGTLYGPTWTTGKVGSALQFDGVNNDYVTIPDSDDWYFGTGDMAITGWIKTSDSEGYILYQGDSEGSFTSISFILAIGEFGNPGKIVFSPNYNIGPNHNESISTNAVNDNNWHSFVINRVNNIFSMYVDGLQTGNTLNLNEYSMINSPQAVYMGKHAGPYWLLNGSIDEIAIYNRALNADEIQQQYNNECIDTIIGLQQIINTLSDEIKNSLISKVDNALKSINKENDDAAINMLNAFINQVNAQREKKISVEAADMLIKYANNVITKIKFG